MNEKAFGKQAEKGALNTYEDSYKKETLSDKEKELFKRFIDFNRKEEVFLEDLTKEEIFYIFNQYKEAVDLEKKLKTIYEEVNSDKRLKYENFLYFEEGLEEFFFELLKIKEARKQIFTDLLSEIGNSRFKHKVFRHLAYFLSQQDDFDSNAGNRVKPWAEIPDIKNEIMELLDKPDNVFFYDQYLKSICENKKYIEEENQHLVPYEVSEGIFIDQFGKTISRPSSYQKVKEISKDKSRLSEDELEPLFYDIEASDLAISKVNFSSEDKEDFSFFQRKGFRNTLEEKLDISFKNLSLPEQFQFLLYSKTTTNQKIEELNSFLKNYKYSGLKTFLSAEHGGREMGDTILSLGEKLEKSEAEKIFGEYSKLIDSTMFLSKELQTTFENEEKEEFKTIPFQIQDALMLRAKDILVGALKVVEDSTQKLETKDVLCAIEGIRTVVEMLSDLKTQKQFEFTKQNQTQPDLFKYNIKDKNGFDYGLKVFIRERPEKNAQARINIELSFDTTNPNLILQKAFQNEVVSHTQNKTKSASVLRIGLDREEHGQGASVSLDIGRSERSDAELSRTGDVLGNLLSLVSDEGHHTTSPFDTRLAEEENFALLASKLKDYLANQDLS